MVHNNYHESYFYGATAWIDVKDLLPGQDWRHSITTAIRASACFIALLSSASVGKRDSMGTPHTFAVYGDK